MASGLPDYLNGVDIALQSVSEVINRPKYGAAQRTITAKVVVANDLTKLITVDGKGMTYGGIVYLDHTVSQKDSVVRVTIDSRLLTLWPFDDMVKVGLSVQHSNPSYILKYDETNFIYCIGIQNGLTFESEVLIEYDEKDGGTPIVAAMLVYALI